MKILFKLYVLLMALSLASCSDGYTYSYSECLSSSSWMADPVPNLPSGLSCMGCMNNNEWGALCRYSFSEIEDGDLAGFKTVKPTRCEFIFMDSTEFSGILASSEEGSEFYTRNVCIDSLADRLVLVDVGKKLIWIEALYPDFGGDGGCRSDDPKWDSWPAIFQQR